MSTEENVQLVKNFFAAMGSGKRVCWRCLPKILSGSFRAKDWPLAGTHRGHAGLADLLKKAPKRWKLHTQSPPNS